MHSYMCTTRNDKVQQSPNNYMANHNLATMHQDTTLPVKHIRDWSLIAEGWLLQIALFFLCFMRWLRHCWVFSRLSPSSLLAFSLAMSHMHNVALCCHLSFVASTECKTGLIHHLAVGRGMTTYYGCTADHVMKFPRPSPSIFTYCKQSIMGRVEDLGTRHFADMDCAFMCQCFSAAAI